jgi:hypothetical protein
MLTFGRPGGKREMIRFVTDKLEAGVEQGRRQEKTSARALTTLETLDSRPLR